MSRSESLNDAIPAMRLVRIPRFVSTNGATRTPGTGQPFSDVRQPQLIPGMLPDWVAAVAPLATVFGDEP